MCNVKDKIKTAAKSLYETLINLFVLSSYGLAAFGIILLLVLLVSIYIASIISINTYTIGLMTISGNLLLVFITGIYVIFTGQIVSESKKETKIANIEKRLEKLYYPLQDFIKSPIVFKVYYYDEIMEATCYEQLAKEKAEAEKGIYTRPADSILNDCEVQNETVKRYNLDSIIPYKYLATKELFEQLELLIEDFREINPFEIASSDPMFKSRIDKIKETINTDINSLIREHAKLL